MGTKTGISWTDATWNPIRGCSRVSEGCRHCYAESIAHRFSGPGMPYEGLVQLNAEGKSTGKWNGQIKFLEEHLLDPLGWRKPRRIFVNSMSDLFHENVTDEMRDRIFAVMALCPQHTFQVLTKRPERLKKYLSGKKVRFRVGAIAVQMQEKAAGPVYDPRSDETWPLPNVHLGVSVEDQKTADERVPLLLQTPAAVRFISAEPLLGPLRLAMADEEFGFWIDFLKPFEVGDPPIPALDWVIVGGESGTGARPMHPDWARSLRDQCKAAGVPFFFKQWGAWIDGFNMNDADMGISRGKGIHHWPDVKYLSDEVGTKAAGCLLDGVEHHEFPTVCA